MNNEECCIEEMIFLLHCAVKSFKKSKKSCPLEKGLGGIVRCFKYFCEEDKKQRVRYLIPELSFEEVLKTRSTSKLFHAISYAYSQIALENLEKEYNKSPEDHQKTCEYATHMMKQIKDVEFVDYLNKAIKAIDILDKYAPIAIEKEDLEFTDMMLKDLKHERRGPYLNLLDQLYGIGE